MRKELAKTYAPKEFEDRIYHNWEEKGYFHAEIDPKKKPYTIVIPPPNICLLYTSPSPRDCS